MLVAKYDVIVLGIGPAGLAAAITCIQNGLSVLLISNDRKVQNPMPAESVHPGIMTILSKLKAEDSLIESSIGGYSGIKTGVNISILGADEMGKWIGRHINRAVFDQAFLHSALEQGVAYFGNSKVNKLIVVDNFIAGIITDSGNKIISKYVIDATGAKRIGGKVMKFEELFFSPPLICWSGISSCIEPDNLLFQDCNASFIPNRYGWLWIAATPPNKCTWTILSLKGKQNFSPPDTLRKYPLVGSIRKANMRWRLFRPLSKEGIILCGDAAGILDPAAGQGILNALYSGIKAADTVSSILKNPDTERASLDQYESWFSTLFINKINILKKYYFEHGIDIFNND